MIFPEIFITGKLPKNWSLESLVADGLSGWGCCLAGATPPKLFGEGMVLISEKTGAGTPEQLSDLADKIIKKNMETKEKDLEIYDIYKTPNGNLFIKMTDDYSIAIGHKGDHKPSEVWKELEKTQFVKLSDFIPVKKVGRLVFDY